MNPMDCVGLANVLKKGKCLFQDKEQVYYECIDACFAILFDEENMLLFCRVN